VFRPGRDRRRGLGYLEGKARESADAVEGLRVRGLRFRVKELALGFKRG